MPLEPIVYLIGILSIIYVAISTYVGLTIASKYFKYKRRIFLLMGFTWVFICCPWWPSSISFILALITGKGLTVHSYILIGTSCIPLVLSLLATSYAELKYKDKLKSTVIVFIVITILFEIYLIYFVVVDVHQLGKLHGIVDVEYGGFLRYLLIGMTISGVTIGGLIAAELIKSENPDLKLKGKLILTAFLIWPIGSVIDAILPVTVLIVTICRIIMIISSILFYFGFLGRMEESEELDIHFLEEKEEIEGFLELVAKHKHKKLTEEEITFYKEQKICLVCKNKTSRLTYICPDCDAIYCVKCSNALSNLENACWVCETAFDPSKPVKISEEEIPVKEISHEKKGEKNS
jgi:hypothetical protein